MVVAEWDTTGLPISYCLLSTATSLEHHKRLKSIARWLKAIRQLYGIKPRFAHVDKDMAEIGAIMQIWPKAKVALCWWHMKRALRTRVTDPKLPTTPYLEDRAHAEFSLIDRPFLPLSKPDHTEYKGGPPGDKKRPDVPYKDPNAIVMHIPANQAPLASKSIHDE